MIWRYSFYINKINNSIQNVIMSQNVYIKYVLSITVGLVFFKAFWLPKNGSNFVGFFSRGGGVFYSQTIINTFSFSWIGFFNFSRFISQGGCGQKTQAEENWSLHCCTLISYALCFVVCTTIFVIQSKPYKMFAATLQPSWPKTNVTLLFYFLKLYNFSLNELLLL